MILDYLVEMIRSVAGFGANVVSTATAYQPKTPACLLEDGE